METLVDGTSPREWGGATWLSLQAVHARMGIILILRRPRCLCPVFRGLFATRFNLIDTPS